MKDTQLMRINLKFLANRTLNKTRIFLRSNWKLCLAIAVYTSIFSAITILKNYVFLTSIDLAIYNQALWTTLFNGKFFYSTGDLSFNPSGSFFGTHFSPILFLLLPLYAVYPREETLLVLQSVVLALGAIPIYWVARDKLSKNAALLVSVLYLAYPPLHYVNLFDFHIEVFTSTLFLFGVYYLEHEKWKVFFLVAVMAMSTIEFAPIIAIFMAIYGLTLYMRKKFKDQKRAFRNMILLTVIAVFWFILAMKAKEFFNPHTWFIPSQWHDILRNPASILSIVSDNLGSKIFYLIGFLGPLLFLPLLAFEPLIMAIPWVGASFISNLPSHYWIYVHYNTFIIPFVFISLVKVFEKFYHGNSSYGTLKKLLTVSFLSIIIFGAYFPVAPNTPWMYQLPIPDDRTELLQRTLALVPPDKSILTQNDIFPHVSDRSNAYVYVPALNASDISIDYVLIDINSIWGGWSAPALVGEKISPLAFASKALQDGDYGILASAKGILLLKRNYTGDPILFVPSAARYDSNSLKVGKGILIGDQTSSSQQVIYRDSQNGEGFMAYGPYATLCPGLYTVTFAVKVEPNVNSTDQPFTVDAVTSAGKILLAKDYADRTNVPIGGQWFNMSMTFRLNDITNNIEFRLYARGSYRVYLDYVFVEQLSAKTVSSKEYSFNYRNFRVGEAKTYGGVITHTIEPGLVWYGPYANIPRGNYTAKFWLRLDEPYDGSLIDLDVATNAGRNQLVKVTLDSSSVVFGSWQHFDLNFSLTSDGVQVEFRGLNARERAPISLLIVEVMVEG